MQEDVLLLRASAQLLKQISLRKETTLSVVERLGLAKALSSCGSFEFLFTDDMAFNLAGVFDDMATQVECVNQIQERTAP
jgi:hypothetical protein